MVCGACEKPIATGKDNTDDVTNTITCSNCSNIYHVRCLNMCRDEIRAYRTKRSQYVCASCKLQATKEANRDNTPTSKSQKPNQDSEGCDSMIFTQDLSTMEVPAQTMASFTKALTDLQKVFLSMKNEMQDLTSSLNSTSEDIATFRQELTEMKIQLRELDKCKKEVAGLRAEVTSLRQEIATKEQRCLLRDVEVTGITENKNENLHQIVNVLSSTLGVDLDPRDVDDIRRVGQRGGGGALEQPRPIVVTMTRRAPRDELLRAARTRRGLTTDKINLPGNPRQTSSVLRVSTIEVLERLEKQNNIPEGNQDPQNCS
ncbi:hypothetical protein ACJJTC_017746 [Scirpophaga incertulas]